MNKLAKILIIVDVVFCLSFTVFMGLGWLNISSEDIARVGAIIMSPELLVGLNKMCEKFEKKGAKTEEGAEEKTEEKKEEAKG